VVSFTLTPMMCARFLRKKKRKPGDATNHGHSAGQQKGFWGWVTRRYVGLLRWCLGGKYGWHRGVVVLGAFCVFLSTPVLFIMVGTDFVPKDDQSEFEVALTLPEGYTLDRASEETAVVEKEMKQLPGVTHVFTTIGETSGKQAKGQGDVTKVTIYCKMIDLKKRKFGQRDTMADARKVLAKYPDYRATVQEVKLFSSSAFKNVQLEVSLRGPDSEKLQQHADRIAKKMRKNPHFTDVDTNAASRNPELQVQIDRDKAADLGVNVQTLASTLQVFVGGEPVTKYKEGAEQYDVWLRADLPNRDRPEAVSDLTVPSSSGQLVELRNVAKLNSARGPAAIERYNRQRQVTVTCNLAPGIALGNALPEVDEYVQEEQMGPEYQYEFLGEAKLMADSNSNFAIAFLLAFIFMYMILAAQFESLIHPATILLAVPLTLPFALISLFLLRTPLDVYAMIGLFMLFGIVKKNGILQVDYTNVLRAKGVPRDQAILKANEARLRPILMTTIMLVAAMIPIATGQGPGAGARASMAKVILGGQLLSLLLTLLVTPVAYSLWDDLSRVARRIWSAKPADEVDEDNDTLLELSTVGLLEHAPDERYPDQKPQAL